ncbi:unnamed protein product [Diamesa serratosioi]
MVDVQDICHFIKHDRQVVAYTLDDGTSKKYQLSQKLFNNFKIKRKQAKNKTCELNEMENQALAFLQVCKLNKLFKKYDDDKMYEMKSENISLMNQFYENSKQSSENKFHGENNLNSGKLAVINDNNYLIPPECKFFNKNIEDIVSCLPICDENKFDFIVMDPPWENRYIKRLKQTTKSQRYLIIHSNLKTVLIFFFLFSYSMLQNKEILQIPLENYIKVNTLVIIWCTNSESHINAIKNDFLSKWNLKLLTTWHWIKVDLNGETFCSFSDNKKPYEIIFIATHKNNNNLHEDVQKDLLIFSNPSSIHSHKPPLIELFIKHLPISPKCLEIFARSLYTNFTSIGLEVLKLQNSTLYDEIIL